MVIKNNYSLKAFNSFGLDVTSKYFLTISSEKDVHSYLENDKFKKEKILIFGAGSNILFSSNFDGLVIKSNILGIKEIKKDLESVILEVGSGVIWDDLVNFCVENNYGGVENLSLIPGTVGAAPIQNIGAYGVEFEEVFEMLQGINLETGQFQEYNRSDCEFEYRDSIFKRKLKNKFIITKVTIKLDIVPKLKTNYRAINEYISENKISDLSVKTISNIVREIRMAKLPDPKKLGNAGSFFKNPVVDGDLFKKLKNEYSDLVFFNIGKNKFKIPAGWLIEKMGFKGIRVGNIGVHRKQALVLVNYGAATGKEIINLSEKIKAKNFEKFNIILETEVNIV